MIMLSWKMSLSKQFVEKINEVKENKELIDIIKKDAKLYEHILKVIQSIKTWVELNQKQIEFVNWLLNKIEKKEEVLVNREKMNEIMKWLKDLKKDLDNWIFMLEDFWFNEDEMKIIKTVLENIKE